MFTRMLRNIKKFLILGMELKIVVTVIIHIRVMQKAKGSQVFMDRGGSNDAQFLAEELLSTVDIWGELVFCQRMASIRIFVFQWNIIASNPNVEE